MVPDNFQANASTISGGPVIRFLNRVGLGSVLTQVIQLDVGGGDANSELLVSNNNPMPVTTAASGAFANSTNANITNVTASTSSVTGLAGNISRIDAIFYNDASSVCRLALGSTASNTNFSMLLNPGDSLSLSQFRAIYTGAVYLIWTGNTGSMRITELT